MPAMPPTRRHATPAHRRLALLALGVALGLGVAGRVAIHAGGHLPHGEALAALGRALVALGAEALLLAGQWAGRAAAVVLAVELAAGLGLLAAARRRTPLLLTLAVFAVAALAFAGIEDGVRDMLRLAGWAGP